MSKMKPASLIKITLRIISQPDDGFTPDAVFVKPKYTFNNNKFYVTAGNSLGNQSMDPMERSRKHFDNMRQKGWTGNWIATYQKDHFLEVQHVVDILAGGPLGQGKWLSAPYAQYLHLSWYLNDRRNTWNIPASLNNRKGCIRLFQYTHPEQRSTLTGQHGVEGAQLDYLTEYLFCFSQEGTTPFLELIDLCIEMAACDENEVTKLTKYVGKRVFDELVSAYLRWSAAQEDGRYDRSMFENYFRERAQSHFALDAESSVLQFATAKLVDGQ